MSKALAYAPEPVSEYGEVTDTYAKALEELIPYGFQAIQGIRWFTSRLEVTIAQTEKLIEYINERCPGDGTDTFGELLENAKIARAKGLELIEKYEQHIRLSQKEIPQKGKYD